MNHKILDIQKFGASYMVYHHYYHYLSYEVTLKYYGEWTY